MNLISQNGRARTILVGARLGLTKNFLWRQLTMVMQVTAGVLACLTPMQTFADWPQILGPNRDGQATGSAIGAPWPKELLSQPAWTMKVGAGFAGVAISGDRVLVFHRVGQSEYLQAASFETGEVIWSLSWPATYSGTINSDSGPRCVPIVSDGKVICYGAAGDLACVNLSNGKEIWRKPVRREFGAEDGYFGAGSSPLVLDRTVIVNVGGKLGGIVGFDLLTGAKKWTATDYDASYASPIAVNSRNGQLVLVITRLKTVLLDPQTGSIRNEIDFGSRGPTVNAAMPISVGQGKYFLTASYGIGATLVDVSTGKINTVYRGKTTMSRQYNSPVAVGEAVIGIDGREDAGRASLRAINPISSQVVWSQDDFGTANLIAAGNKVLIIGLDGQVRLIDGQANTYRELAKGDLPNGTYRALPALSRNRLVVRSSGDDGFGKVVCVELPGEK